MIKLLLCLVTLSSLNVFASSNDQENFVIVDGKKFCKSEQTQKLYFYDFLKADGRPLPAEQIRFQVIDERGLVIFTFRRDAEGTLAFRNSLNEEVQVIVYNGGGMEVTFIDVYGYVHSTDNPIYYPGHDICTK